MRLYICIKIVLYVCMFKSLNAFSPGGGGGGGEREREKKGREDGGGGDGERGGRRNKG